MSRPPSCPARQPQPIVAGCATRADTPQGRRAQLSNLLRRDDLLGPLRDVIVAVDVLERQPERELLGSVLAAGLRREERRHPDLRPVRADEPDAEVALARHRDPEHRLVGRAERLRERRPPPPRVRQRWPWFAVTSSIGGALPSAFTTHSVAVRRVRSVIARAVEQHPLAVGRQRRVVVVVAGF